MKENDFRSSDRVKEVNAKCKGFKRKFPLHTLHLFAFNSSTLNNYNKHM